MSFDLIKALFLAVRPKTLSAAFVPVVAATALAIRHGIFCSICFWCALLSATCIQIATNLFNDAIDFKKGADTSIRLGPTRVTAAGLLSPKAVFISAIIFSFLALLLGIPLVIKGGLPIVSIGLTSLLFAYFYTGGPYPLAYKGLGEVFVILFFGVIAVGGTYYLHTASYSIEALILGLQIGLLATALIAINNFRDHEQDIHAKKMTLAVRFGPIFAKKVICICFLSPFLLGIFWLLYNPFSALLPLCALPLAIQSASAFRKMTPSQECNRYLARASLIHVLFGILISISFAL